MYKFVYNHAMKTLGFSAARRELSRLVDEVAQKQEHVVITKQGRPKAVVMSSDEFESWQETLEIMADPEAMASIKRGLRDIKAGRVTAYDEVRKRLRL